MSTRDRVTPGSNPDIKFGNELVNEFGSNLGSDLGSFGKALVCPDIRVAMRRCKAMNPNA